MEHFNTQLADLERNFLEQFESEAYNTFTVHIYDVEGNLLNSKTFTDELIMNFDLLLPDDYKYITTIHGEPYYIHDL